MAAITAPQAWVGPSTTRQRVMGIVFLFLAFSIWWLFGRTASGEQVTVFNLTPGASTVIVPDWQLPTLSTLYVLAMVSAVLGGVQLARGFGRLTNRVLGLAAGLLSFCLLV